MTIQTITALPTPVPSRLDPVNFSSRADAFLGALPTFGAELNEFATEANALALQVQNNKNSVDETYSDMQDLENVMESIYNNSVATSNFKGVWASLTGVLLKPSSVFHNNSYWILLSDLTDVTLSEPSEFNTDWLKSNLKALDTSYDSIESSLLATNVQEAIDKVYDYASGYLGNGSSINVSESAKKTAREWLGIGSFGFKNRIINPEFIVNQEFGTGNPVTVVAGATIKYVVDQWYATCSGANIIAQQIAGISNKRVSLRLSGSNSNSGFRLGQRIEHLNTTDLQNDAVTVSFNSKSSNPRTITWSIFSADTLDNFTTKTLLYTGSINITTDVKKHQFTFNTGNNTSNGIAIEFSGNTLGTSETIDFDSVQMEISSIATEFEKRAYCSELILCQRYYEGGARRERYLGAYGNAIVGRFFVEKRVTPTVGIYNGGTANAVNVAGSNVVISSLTVGVFDYAFNTTAVGTVNTQYLANWILFASARL